MGFDIGAAISNAANSLGQDAQDAWGKVQSEGLPALAGYAEAQGIAILQADQTQQQTKVQAAVQADLTRPSSPNSLSGYISGLVQAPILKQYGPSILLGVGVVAVGSLILSKAINAVVGVSILAGGYLLVQMNQSKPSTVGVR